jgi:ribosome-associated protein
MTDDFRSTLDIYVRAALGKKAVRLVALDVRELTSVADAFIICSGRSNRQVMAIADHIQRHLKTNHRIRPLCVEGAGEGHWILLDYAEVVIHVFYEPVRAFYDLEGLWMDAERIVTPAMENLPDDDPAAGDVE